MKVLLDIKDNKADFIMELLNSFSYVKATLISSDKAQTLQEFKVAIDNLNLVKKGKLVPRLAKDLLNEL